MQFTLRGPFKPYVRMTQRGKWVRPEAVAYLDSKAQIARQFKAQMYGQAMLPDKIPLRCIIMISCSSGFHNKDLDNQIKALLDAMQGIVFRNDCWIDSISAIRASGNADIHTVIIEAITNSNQDKLPL